MDPSEVQAIPLFASLSPESAALVASEEVAEVPAGHVLVDHAPRIARVRATKDSRVLAVERTTFERLVETEPSFAPALLRELASRLVRALGGH